MGTPESVTPRQLDVAVQLSDAFESAAREARSTRGVAYIRVWVEYDELPWKQRLRIEHQKDDLLK